MPVELEEVTSGSLIHAETETEYQREDTDSEVHDLFPPDSGIGTHGSSILSSVAIQTSSHDSGVYGEKLFTIFNNLNLS